MTVQELFEAEDIDPDFVSEKMYDGSPYWESCSRFVTENWDREIESLTDKQAAWLTRILDDCVERRIEGKK